MNGRAAIGWQTTLADLSLILFLITAAAVSHRVPRPARPGSPPPVAAAAAAGLRAPSSTAALDPGVPELAIWVAGPGAPPLGQWLAGQARDPRQQLTVLVRYPPAQGPAAAIASATDLLREAGAAGRRGRLVVEPGEGAPRAILAFDAGR